MQQAYQCSNCHTPVAFGMRFCGNCGMQLTWTTQQQMQPPPVKRRGVGQWIRNHKFWSSVIILFVLVEVLSLFNLINAYEAGYTGGVYTALGGLIWSIQAKRKGLTMITVGSFFALTAILWWAIAISGGFADMEGFAIGMAGFLTLSSVLFLLFGIRRYRGTGTVR